MLRLSDFLLKLCVLFYVVLTVVCFCARADEESALSELRKTTVMVSGFGCSGSGFLVQGKSGKTYLATNAHVCNCSRYYGVVFATYEGGQLIKAHVDKLDWSSDLCAASVEEAHPALSVASMLLPLQMVYTRGYPFGRLAESSGRVGGVVPWVTEMLIDEVGKCPPKTKEIYGPRGTLEGCLMRFISILTSLYSRPGSSGSPVVNESGELVGVVSSFHGGNGYSAGMVPLPDVIRFLGGL